MSKRLGLFLLLVLVGVVFTVAACAPASTATPVPTATAVPTARAVSPTSASPTTAAPAANPTSEVGVSPIVDPTATSPTPEKVVVTQRINDMGGLPLSGPLEHVDVVYFHLTERCPTCIENEWLIRKTLDTYFADRLKRGEMSLVVADIQKPENFALVQKFDAAYPALYLGIVKSGIEYTFPVNDIWMWPRDEAGFMRSLSIKINTVYGLED